MADILKITTPLTKPNHIPTANQPNGLEAPFEISDLSKVIKSQKDQQMQGNHNGLVEKEGEQTLLATLLKDPGVTVSYLKNIFLMQEVIKLLPVNNSSFTQEIRQLFDALLVSPEEIVPELLRQEEASTVFKGSIFDYLRGLLQKTDSEGTRYAIANFLKALNGEVGKDRVLQGVANGLRFIQGEVNSSPRLSQEILSVILELGKKGAKEDFSRIKGKVLGLVEEIKGSILFTEKSDKIISMIVYNLSRFTDNPTYLRETLDYLLAMVDGEEEKNRLMESFKEYLQTFETWKSERSKVMDTLAEVVGKQAFSRDLAALHPDRVEKIIHSLLSSPCNFTPLLHFILPVEYMGIKSFAEIWIDQNTYENEEREEENVHMLLVFEIEGIGQFEIELYALNKSLDIILLCPPAYKKSFMGIEEKLKEEMKTLPYGVNRLVIGDFEKTRSLMEVFKNLPHKRTGLDITI